MRANFYWILALSTIYWDLDKENLMYVQCNISITLSRSKVFHYSDMRVSFEECGPSLMGFGPFNMRKQILLDFGPFVRYI